MLSITLLFIIISCSIIIISVDATTISSSAPKNNRIVQATLLEDRELQLFDTNNNSVEEKMDGTCFGNQLDSGQQRSQGSYLWYVVPSSLSNNILLSNIFFTFFCTLATHHYLSLYLSFFCTPPSVTNHTKRNI